MSRPSSALSGIAAIGLSFLALSAPVFSQAADDADQASEGGSAGALAADAAILLELNNAADIQHEIRAENAENGEVTLQGACRMTYVVTNRSDESLRSAIWQVGVFDGSGVVRALLMLGFGDLPANKTKIGVFDIPDWPCDDISRIIVNDVAECTPADAELVETPSGQSGYPQSDICLSGLSPSSRAEIEFGL